jgi:nucleoid-associated protein YgaU
MSNTITKAQLTMALSAIAAAQARVQALLTSAYSTMASVSLLGGVTAGAQASVNTTNLNAQTSAFANAAQLYNLNATLNRLVKNLQQSVTSGQTLTTAGGNLYRIAEQQYGDATAWPLIAQANGLTDPQITGVVTLAIPNDPTSNTQYGGVLNGQ